MPAPSYTTLQKYFLEHVIRIKAVQRWRAAALKESRRPSAPVSTDAVERFFDHGISPGRGHLWRISTAELGKAPAKPTALYQAMAAAWNAWRQLVRELCADTLVVTGEKIKSVRRKIGPDTWLDENLWFDVRANTIVTNKWSYGEHMIPVWAELQVRETDEAAEFEDDQPAKENAPTAGKHKGHPREIHWEDMRAAIDERVAKHGPFPRHENDQPHQAAAVRRMMEWFNEKQRRGPSDPRQCYAWLENNPQPWWGRGPEPTPKLKPKLK